MLRPFWCNDSTTTLRTLDDWPFTHGGTPLSVPRHPWEGDCLKNPARLRSPNQLLLQDLSEQRRGGLLRILLSWRPQSSSLARRQYPCANFVGISSAHKKYICERILDPQTRFKTYLRVGNSSHGKRCVGKPSTQDVACGASLRTEPVDQKDYYHEGHGNRPQRKIGPAHQQIEFFSTHSEIA